MFAFMVVSMIVRYFNAYSIEIATGSLAVLLAKRESYLHKITCIGIERDTICISVSLNT